MLKINGLANFKTTDDQRMNLTGLSPSAQVKPNKSYKSVKAESKNKTLNINVKSVENI